MDKSVLITGATSGIGKALAFELAQRGYSLALTARRTDTLKQVRDEIKRRYPAQTVEIRTLDVVVDYKSIPLVLKELADALNGLDIVFANAGIGLRGKIGQARFENAKRTIETNLIGAMATVDAAVAYFKEKGRGHIVGISSVSAFRGMPYNSAYCASKAGFSAYLEALQAEVCQDNIDVTILHPGFIDTPLNNMLPNRPFVIPVEKGAAIIARLVEKKVKSSTVPVFPWNVIGVLLKLLPAKIIAKIIKE